MILKDGEKNIGYVQLVPIGEGKWEIGHHVAKPYTCKGYATEAVTAFLPVMAEKDGIHEVYGFVCWKMLLQDAFWKNAVLKLFLSEKVTTTVEYMK